jgi:hypothetical protein
MTIYPQSLREYKSPNGELSAKVTSCDGVYVKYIIEGQLRTCTIEEFEELFVVFPTKRKRLEYEKKRKLKSKE